MEDKNNIEASIDELIYEITKRLKKGDIIEVSNLTGVTHMTAWNHIKKRVKNPSMMILEATIDVIEKREKIESVNEEAYKKLLKKFRNGKN